MRTLPLAFTFLALSAVSASAQVAILDDTSIGGKDRYENCLLLVKHEPQRALNAALDWEKLGNPAGTHCAALALVALRRYSDAASILDKMARATHGAVDSATLFDQAGNAWLLAHRATDAQASFSAAIALSPGDPDLLADRARAYALIPNWGAADADLSAALAKGGRADLFILRASARHAEGRKADAMADLNQALKLQPASAEALELRGEMKSEAGDNAGAKVDWQAAVAASPHSTSGQDAKQRLDSLNAPAQPAATPPK